jgi:hypothetical protein
MLCTNCDPANNDKPIEKEEKKRQLRTNKEIQLRTDRDPTTRNFPFLQMQRNLKLVNESS